MRRGHTKRLAKRGRKLVWIFVADLVCNFCNSAVRFGQQLLCQLQADTALSPQRTAAARAAAWDAFFRQNAELLPTTLPDALRGVSSLLLTDLTALDYDALGRTLEFLANNSAAVEAQALPGRWNAASGTYTVTDASRAAMQTFFNVSLTEAQASSFKEP